MNTKDLAKHLDLSEVTLRIWRTKKDKGPRWVKVGGRVRYSKVDVERWITENTSK